MDLSFSQKDASPNSFPLSRYDIALIDLALLMSVRNELSIETAQDDFVENPYRASDAL